MFNFTSSSSSEIKNQKLDTSVAHAKRCRRDDNNWGLVCTRPITHILNSSITGGTSSECAASYRDIVCGTCCGIPGANVELRYLSAFTCSHGSPVSIDCGIHARAILSCLVRRNSADGISFFFLI